MFESESPQGGDAHSVDATSTGHLRATVGSLGGSGSRTARQHRDAETEPGETLEPLPTPPAPVGHDPLSRRVRSRRRARGYRWPSICPACAYQIAEMPDRDCPECGLDRGEILCIIYWRRARKEAWQWLALTVAATVAFAAAPIIGQQRAWIPPVAGIGSGLFTIAVTTIIVARHGPSSLAGTVLTAWLRLLPLLLAPLSVAALATSALGWSDVAVTLGEQRWLAARVAILVAGATLGFAAFAIRWPQLNDRRWIETSGDRIALLAFATLLGSVGGGWLMLALPPFG